MEENTVSLLYVFHVQAMVIVGIFFVIQTIKLIVSIFQKDENDGR